ncbi:MAG: histidine kinase dimerization/phospho-acceptor domain-containing protein, partial [Acidimicrobiales bacterium]
MASQHIAQLATLLATTKDLPAPEVYGVGAAILVVGVLAASMLGRRSGRRAIAQRLTALGNRLGIGAPLEDTNIETALSYLEQVTGAATEAVADTSADAIRLRRSLDTLSQGVVLCDESGAVVYRNARANALMTSRHGDALAAQAVTELLEDAWDSGTAERTLDLYGPPRRTLSVRARLIDDGRRSLGVIAMIEDVSERRRLEEIRRDFVANVSHELKTPMGAIGLLAETLVAEPDFEVARRLASRIHTEAFRVSRIIDDLLDLTRIESEEAPPREPVLVNLVMAEAVERVRASAEQRGLTITLREPDPPVAVLGDRRQLVSAMHALIENAVTYSYEKSTVAVVASLGPAPLPADDDTAQATAPAGATSAFAPVASTIVTAQGLAPVSPEPTSAAPPAESKGPNGQNGHAANGAVVPGVTVVPAASAG